MSNIVQSDLGLHRGCRWRAINAGFGGSAGHLPAEMELKRSLLEERKAHRTSCSYDGRNVEKDSCSGLIGGIYSNC
jgi:hypothetical protein